MRLLQLKLMNTAVLVLAALVASPVLADTLELRVVSDGDASVTAGGGVVNVYIQGRIQNPTDFGLALWGVNLSDTSGNGFDVSGAVLDSPGGDIDQFKKNLGLTNPSGYGGTPIAGNLIQIGGGQNTIGNTGPTLFPVGTVATNVANGAMWVDLAVGQIDTTSAAGDVVLTLDTGFANSLASDSGPFYPVNPATVSIGGELTIGQCIGCGEFVQVFSTANHNANGSFGGGDLDIPIDPSDGAAISDLTEPRQFSAAGAGDLKVRVDFAEAIASGSVVSTPPLGSLTATPNGNSLEITFDGPANGSCYNFDLTGTQAQGGSVIGPGSGDTDFCICYFEGDINYDGFVNLADRSVVAQPGNLFSTVDAAGITGPQVDLNRDGIINLADRLIIAQSSNLFNDFSAVGCP